MLILLELFPNFFEVHYKLLQRILQNFNAGGLLSEWSFVRVVFCLGLAFSVVFCPVVFCPYTVDYKSGLLACKLHWVLQNSEASKNKIRRTDSLLRFHWIHSISHHCPMK